MTIKQLYPTQRPALDLNFARQKRLDPRVTFTRGSIATYVGSDGLIKTVADHEPRFDHDPETGESLGLLIEEARTNSVSLSIPQGTTPWSPRANTLYTLNAATAPDGTLTATKVSANVGNTGYAWARYTLGTAITGSSVVSVYAKDAGEGGCTVEANNTSGQSIYWFDFTTKTFGNRTGSGDGSDPRYQELPNGWFRLSFSVGPGCNHITLNARYGWSGVMPTGDGVKGVLFWGAQLEAGTFPTSYIPTSGLTIQRGADVTSMTGTNFSSWYNQSEGSWFVNYEATFGKEDTTVFTFNASNNNRIFSYTANNRVQFKYGGPTVNSNRATTTNDYAKAVMFYESDGTFGGSFEGTAVVSAAGTPNTATELNLAPFPGAGGALQSSTSHISRIAYYPVRLPDATLQALTL